MAHKIFGYKGFVVKVIPHEIVSKPSPSRQRIRYAASVVIMRFTGAARHKHAMRCYPSGVCVTPEHALMLGTEYATHVIDEDFSNTVLMEQPSFI
ncbi:MAG: hypothetical protein WCC11_02775 [Gammaproteobacteria bacterium]